MKDTWNRKADREPNQGPPKGVSQLGDTKKEPVHLKTLTVFVVEVIGNRCIEVYRMDTTMPMSQIVIIETDDIIMASTDPETLTRKGLMKTILWNLGDSREKFWAWENVRIFGESLQNQNSKFRLKLCLCFQGSSLNIFSV